MLKLKTALQKIQLADLYCFIFILPPLINPWGFTFYEAPKIIFLRIFLSVAFLIILFLFFKKGGGELYLNKKVLFLTIAWLASLTLSTIFSIAPALSFWGSYDRIQGLLSHVFYLLHFLILLQYLQQKDAHLKIFKWIYWISIVIAIYAIAQKFGVLLFSGEANPGFLGRVYSTLGQPNFLGQYLIFPIWIGIYFLKNNPSKKFINVLSLLSLLTALVLTENRATILGFIISLGIFIPFISEKIKKYRKIIWVGLVLIFAAFILVIAPNTRSLQSRFLIWKNLPPLISEHLIVGSGPETFFLTSPKNYDPQLVYFEKPGNIADRAHNEPLDILITQGIIGLLIYIGVLALMMIQIFKKPELFRQPAFVITFCAFIATIIANFYSFQLSSHYLMFYTMLAVLLSYLVKFHKVPIRQNLGTTFLCGIVGSLALINIAQAYNTLDGDNHFGKSIDAIAAKNYRQAITELSLANELNPQQGYIYFFSGHFLTEAGTAITEPSILNMAEEALNKSATFNGPNFEYFMAMGRLKTAAKDYPAAAQSYAAAQALAPNNTSVYGEWGNMLYTHGDYAAAIKKLEKRLELLPNYWQWTGQLQQKTPAEKDLYRILFKNIPELTDTLSMLAKSYQEIGNKTKSDYYTKLIPL